MWLYSRRVQAQMGLMIAAHPTRSSNLEQSIHLNNLFSCLIGKVFILSGQVLQASWQFFLFEGVEPSELKPRPNKEGKSLEEFLNESFPSDSRHKFEMRVVEAQTGNPEFMKSFEESLQVSLSVGPMQYTQE